MPGAKWHQVLRIVNPQRSSRRGCLSIDEAFDLKADPDIDQPFSKVIKTSLKASVTSPDTDTLTAKIFETEKQIYSMNSTINLILTQQEELCESFCNILQEIKPTAATSLMVEGIQPCLAKLLAKYDSLVMITGQ